MLKKTYTFGLLAAVILAPTAAFANEKSQGNVQEINQNAVVEGVGNSVGQSATQSNIQQQQNRTRNIYGKFCRPVLRSQQQQGSAQVANQNAAASGVANTIGQISNQGSIQGQNSVVKSKGACN